jgi:hypothetical protein
MAKALANIRIYGDETSVVSVAPLGTSFAAGLAAPSVTFVELGWISEDGVEINRTKDVKKFKAWQGGATVRQKIVGVEDTFKFQCLEETAITLGLYYPGSSSVTATGVTTITVPAGATADERAWVLRFFDGPIEKRYNIPRGEVGETASIVHKSTDMTIYEYTVTSLGGFTIITNNPAAASA